jgi:hypothetical protein
VVLREKRGPGRAKIEAPEILFNGLFDVAWIAGALGTVRVSWRRLGAIPSHFEVAPCARAYSLPLLLLSPSSLLAVKAQRCQ